MTRLEIRTAIKRRNRGGAVIGGVAGVVAGLIAAHSVGDICEGNPYYGTQSCRRDTSADVPLAIAGGLAGTGIGALIGWFARSETWIPASQGR